MKVNVGIQPKSTLETLMAFLCGGGLILLSIDIVRTMILSIRPTSLRHNRWTDVKDSRVVKLIDTKIVKKKLFEKWLWSLLINLTVN